MPAEGLPDFYQRPGLGLFPQTPLHVGQDVLFELGPDLDRLHDLDCGHGLSLLPKSGQDMLDQFATPEQMAPLSSRCYAVHVRGRGKQLHGLIQGLDVRLDPVKLVFDGRDAAQEFRLLPQQLGYDM